MYKKFGKLHKSTYLLIINMNSYYNFIVGYFNCRCKCTKCSLLTIKNKEHLKTYSPFYVLQNIHFFVIITAILFVAYSMSFYCQKYVLQFCVMLTLLCVILHGSFTERY